MSKKLTLDEIKAETRRNYADWAGWQERENARAEAAARRSADVGVRDAASSGGVRGGGRCGRGDVREGV